MFNLTNPTRDAYNFSGWTLNGEAISEIAHGSMGDKTLTATWEETKPIISPASYALTVYKAVIKPYAECNRNES